MEPPIAPPREGLFCALRSGRLPDPPMPFQCRRFLSQFYTFVKLC